MNNNLNQNRLLAISASAGTGKTYALAVRYICLLAAGAAPESIVAMTFTRKAAGEILDRIIRLLCEWIGDKNEFEKACESNRHLNVEYGDLSSLLHSMLMNIHRLQISTLDAFYVNIIRAFPFEFGLSGEFKIIDAPAEEYAKSAIINEVLCGNTDEQEKRNFLDAFRMATYGDEEKSIIRKMKTYADSNHELFMSAQEERKWGELSLIFGNEIKPFMHKYETMNLPELCEDIKQQFLQNELSEKQKEMIDDFLNDLEDLPENCKFTTKNGVNVFKKLIEQYDDLKTGTAVITLDRKKIALDKNLCDLLSTALNCIVAKIIRLQQKRTKGLYAILRRYESEYERINRGNGIFTFKDVLYKLSDSAINLSSTGSGPDKMYIDYRLDSRFSHWLLDEFQDTSYAQWKVIENLVDEAVQDPEKSFFYVGDIKQSIYQWRHGEPKLFRYIYNQYSGGSGLQTESLVKSYRSYQSIIDIVNKTFGNLKNLTGANQIPERVIERLEWKEHETVKSKKGFAALIGVQSEKKSEKKSDKNMLRRKKAEIIAQRIIEAAPFSRDMSVAILLREHKPSALYAEVLHGYGIPVSIASAPKLCDNPVVSAFISIFTLAEHPQDQFALRHLEMTPFGSLIEEWGISPSKLLEEIYNSGYKLFIQRTVNRIAEEQQEYSSLSSDPVIPALLDAAAEFDEGSNITPGDFVKFLSDYKIKHSTRKGSVQIITVHGSKGLEFDMVFLPELDPSASQNIALASSDISGLQIKRDSFLNAEWAFMMPAKNIAQTQPALAEFIDEKSKDQAYEKLCILYVAMTRAAKALYIITEDNSTKTFKISDILLKTLKADPVPNADLPPLQHGQWLYSIGDPEWFKDETEIATEKHQPAEIPAKKSMRIDFSNELQRATPSGAESFVVVAENLFSGGSSTAMQLGSAVHELFEELEWSDTSSQDDVLDKWRPKKSTYESDISEKAVTLFKNAMQFDEIYNALRKPQFNAVLWREQDFNVIIDGEIISGSFDRVVIEKDAAGKIVRAEITDYKTDQVATAEEIAAKALTYSPQLALYAKVLSKILKIENNAISRQLLFVRPGKRYIL